MHLSDLRPEVSGFSMKNYLKNNLRQAVDFGKTLNLAKYNQLVKSIELPIELPRYYLIVQQRHRNF
jgi:hypothetical protein